MDVFDNRERKIRCMNTAKLGMFTSSENNHLLEVGKEYTLTNVKVYNWYTLIQVKEIPNISFNSVFFEEIDTVYSN